MSIFQSKNNWWSKTCLFDVNLKWFGKIGWSMKYQGRTEGFWKCILSKHLIKKGLKRPWYFINRPIFSNRFKFTPNKHVFDHQLFFDWNMLILGFDLIYQKNAKNPWKPLKNPKIVIFGSNLRINIYQSKNNWA
jgi:hypothetical protein